MGFDRVANNYRFLERVVYGDALQEARIAHLDSLDGELRVLLLGDGDGRLLEALLRKLPTAQVDVVDASSKMIELAKARVAGACGARVEFKCADGFEFLSSARRKGYDLVVSHFFLDCFKRTEIERLVSLVVPVLDELGVWLISDFQVPEKGALERLRARVLLWIMYRFFRSVAGLGASSLVDPTPVLTAAGLSLDGRVVANAGFLRADRWVRNGSP